MQQTIVSGIAMWSVWQPDRNLFFNSFFVATDDGNLAIDPLPLAEADAREIDTRGGLAWIVVTNRDHERGARDLASRTGAKIAASVAEAALLAGPIDRALAPGETIGGATVVALDGLKTPGEIALHFASRRTVILGDALWGDPAGSLRLMPDEKLGDPARAASSLRSVWALRPQHLLVGDGACIFGDAYRVLGATLEARRDSYANRINRDEAIWREPKDEPAGYKGSLFEVGDYIGAEKLGYRLVRVEPHAASSPSHWHAAEEELFVVMTGSATLVTPRGEFALRSGDFVAFPTRASGTHKVENRTDEACEILMVANVDERDVCYYPDSRKLVVESTGVLVRDNPILDYWEGE
ncbi:MAG: cupin domain-containing protein [Candidatus Eremiobacteraeota bacterium]|nr:cupin domain-containing protein [Candidatus Eremiobacteraeota bacterium]